MTSLSRPHTLPHTRPFTRSLAAALACAVLALPVVAQTPPAAPGERPAAHQQWKEQHAKRHAARLDDLKKKLALSAEQEAAWNQFTQAMQPPARPDPAERQAMQKLTTPERIDRMRTLRAERSRAMDARGDAIKSFYAQLTPAQQKTFDAQSPMGQGRHGMHGGKDKGHGAGHHGMRPGKGGAPA